MMDPAVKTALAFCVLLAGVCAALLFRHERPRPAVAACESEEQLSLRSRAATLAPGAAGPWASAVQDSAVAPSVVRPAIVVTPSDRHEPPPSPAPDYPESDRPAKARWGVSMDMMLPVATQGDGQACIHTIVDGDTLAALAERYLGSATRAQEIFEANRDVLRDPELLPIGGELKIPPRNHRPLPPGSLVPVR
jgi:nucleoid-associated protein YgaU